MMPGLWTVWCSRGLAITCLLVAGATAVSASAAGPEPMERSRSAIEAIRSGRPECDLGADQVVRYIGPTDDSLLACLSEYARDGRSLLISSGGGDGRKAIEAGALLARLGWSLRVVGMCASSCGNYLVPAATSVAVEPYSAILLHGGPLDSEAYIQAVQDQVEAKQRTAYPAVTDDLVAEGRAMMRVILLQLVQAQKEFSERHSIAGEWYALSEFDRPAGGLTPTDFAVVDPEYFSRQLGRSEPAEYWFPRSNAEKSDLAALLQGAALFYRRDPIRSPSSVENR